MSAASLLSLRCSRWIAAVTLLAVLFGALPPAARYARAVTPPLAADVEQWLAGADEIQPARIETAGAVRAEKAPAPAPTPPTVLAARAAKQLQAPPPTRTPQREPIPRTAASHERPSPTGPPLFG